MISYDEHANRFLDALLKTSLMARANSQLLVNWKTSTTWSIIRIISASCMVFTDENGQPMDNYLTGGPSLIFLVPNFERRKDLDLYFSKLLNYDVPVGN